MFTNITASYNNGDVLIEAACLSTDTKPTDGIANGSSCIEMDTGDKYMFDEAGGQWIKLGSGGGGQAEVWLVGDTGVEESGRMVFALSNVGDTDHIEELHDNPPNYEIYINGESLPYLMLPTDTTVIFADSDNQANITKFVRIIDNSKTIDAEARYMDASTAPTSVEVSVKAK